VAHTGPLEELSEERFRCALVTSALDKNIQDVAILIHGSPQVVALVIHRQKDLVEVSCIPRLRAATMQLIGIGLPKLPIPFADCFIGHDDAAGEQQLFHLSVAEQKRKYSHTPWLMISAGKR